MLSPYDFEIQHMSGSKHQNADALSRKDVTYVFLCLKNGLILVVKLIILET